MEEKIDPKIKELLDLLELAYPLIVAGTMSARSCSEYTANEVQRVLAKDGRQPRSPHSFSRQELRTLVV